MNKKVRLLVLGFSFNQTESGTYGLVLAEKDGLRRLMVVVGTPEAQSIAFKLHNTESPRPLTHDLFRNMLEALGVELNEIFIYKYENGIFFSHLYLTDKNENTVVIDSRTSDAIAIALRTNSPIYTTEQIMQQLAVVFDTTEGEPDKEKFEEEIPNEEILKIPVRQNDYSKLNKTELLGMLEHALSVEDYELASILRDEINKREKEE